MAKIIKVALIGPSGSGKDTAAFLLQSILKENNICYIRKDVAKPLHNIQKYIYDLFNIKNKGEQDSKLLSFLATKFEKNIIKLFTDELKDVKRTINNEYQNGTIVIINSDCRNNAYKYLKDQDFIFVRINTDYLKIANRIKKRDKIDLHKNSVDDTSDIKEDYNIYNNGSIEDLKQSVIESWSKIFNCFQY